MTVNCEGPVLSFTAPGANLDSVEPAATYILKMAATAANLSEVNFDTGLNELISHEDLVNGSLVPVAGGEVVTIGLSSVRCPADQLFFFATRAVNAEGLSGPVSNVVAALPTCSSPSSAVTQRWWSNGGLVLALILMLIQSFPATYT
jgi:hypothetical protein